MHFVSAVKVIFVLPMSGTGPGFASRGTARCSSHSSAGRTRGGHNRASPPHPRKPPRALPHGLATPALHKLRSSSRSPLPRDARSLSLRSVGIRDSSWPSRPKKHPRTHQKGANVLNGTRRRPTRYDPDGSHPCPSGSDENPPYRLASQAGRSADATRDVPDTRVKDGSR